MYRKIAQIKINNFQSHENSIIKLDPGVNVIVGRTDSGKSAVIRALRWVFFNEPRGTDFIRKGTDAVSVELTYDDGTIVRRIRNKKDNGYEIEVDGQIEYYYGIGSDVPEEVMKITGVRKVKFSENNDPIMINFQNQHDGAFMLNDSPAQKAKSIGYISNVNILDDAIRRANQNEQQSNQAKKRFEEELLTNKDKLKEFENLDTEIANFNLLKSKLENIKELSQKLDKYNYLNNYINDVEKSISIGVDYIKKFDNLDKSLEVATFIIENNNKLKSKNEFLLKYRNILAEEKDLDNIISSLAYIDKYKLIYEKLVFTINKHSGKTILLTKLLENIKQIGLSNKIITKTSCVENIKYNILNITNLKNKYDLYQEQDKKMKFFINEEKYILNEIESSDIENIKNLYVKADKLKDSSNKLKNLYEQLLDNNKEYSILEEDLNATNLGIEEKVNKYIELISLYKKCPLCGSDIDNKHLENIKKEFYYEIWWGIIRN